jgi:hypothetical protein
MRKGFSFAEEERTERLETARWAVLARGQIVGRPRRLEIKIAKRLLGYYMQRRRDSNRLFYVDYNQVIMSKFCIKIIEFVHDNVYSYSLKTFLKIFRFISKDSTKTSCDFCKDFKICCWNW